MFDQVPKVTLKTLESSFGDPFVRLCVLHEVFQQLQIISWGRLRIWSGVPRLQINLDYKYVESAEAGKFSGGEAKLRAKKYILKQ
jgi:hypothetical protein